MGRYAAIAPGTYEFKYAYDSWAGSENLIPGLPCTVTNFGFTNRQLVVTGDTILPLTCWASCGDCLNNYNVTFQVDMSNVSGFNVPEVNGDFNGWCGGCFQLTDPDGNGIYTGTATIQEGLHEFKYAYDGWSGQESLTNGTPCTVTNYGFTNRSINVTQNVTLPVVCFGSCSNCTYAVSNDSPYSATSIASNSLSNFPNCYTMSGNTASASDSPQSGFSTGKDVWYKFTAASTAVSITLSSSSQDDVIGLYSRSGSTFTLLPGGSENSTSALNDMERLNYSGLTPGQTYYACVGSADNNGGAYTMCLQNLLSSGCATVTPVGGLNLCNTFKALYRGSSAQGVTYNFTFNGVGGGATGSASVPNTNGLILLSNPTLGLRYGGIYDVQVDVNYALQDGAGTTDNIAVNGTLASVRCDNVTISSQPNLEVKSTQRCSVATLSRYTYLNAARVNSNAVCGATSYTWVFRRMDDCATPSPTAIDSIVVTTPSVYCQLSVLPDLPAAVGTWGVKVRPNFSYGNGTFGPERYIAVNGTSASALAPENQEADAMKEIAQGEMVLYPNPTSSNSINVYADNLTHEEVIIRVMDATGRIVQSNSYFLQEEINTTLEFNNRLAPGIYSVELNDGGKIRTSRLMIQ